MDLGIQGVECILYKNDVEASNTESGKYLLQWQERNDIWIDRNDVRFLLTEYDQFRKKIYAANHDESDDTDDLMYERYQNLFDLHESEQEYFKTSTIYDSLENNSSDVELINNCDFEDEKFVIPECLLCLTEEISYPSSIFQYQIIMRTTKAVREHRQLEIVLKVKQQSNPQFDFLKCDHHLNPFYEVILKFYHFSFAEY
jgi:hypothetical protein